MIRLVLLLLALALLTLAAASYHGPALHRTPYTPGWTSPSHPGGA